MKFSPRVATSLAFASTLAAATPIKREANSSISSTQVLQLALTLEHLENAFYSEGLAKLDESAFESAGFASWVRGRFVQISQHEASHVQLLTETLGNDSIAPCNYSFPYTDAKSFATLSNMLESVGNGAYIGGSQYLTNDTGALQAAGAILSMEGRHASWVKSAVFLEQPWSGSYDTPLSGSLAYTMAMNLITQCPSSNPHLPFQVFPSLNITSADTNNSTPNPGDTVNVDFYAANGGRREGFLAFLHGLNTTFVNITNSSQATIPSDLQGLVFAVVTSNDSVVSDQTIIAGPAPLTFNFGPDVANY